MENKINYSIPDELIANVSSKLTNIIKQLEPYLITPTSEVNPSTSNIHPNTFELHATKFLPQARTFKVLGKIFRIKVLLRLST